MKKMVAAFALFVALLAVPATYAQDSKLKNSRIVRIESYEKGLVTAVFDGNRYILKCKSSHTWSPKLEHDDYSEDCGFLAGEVGATVLLVPFDALDKPREHGCCWTNGIDWICSRHDTEENSGFTELYNAVSIVPVKRGKAKTGEGSKQ